MSSRVERVTGTRRARRPNVRVMLSKLKHDPEGLELVARVIETLAERSRRSRRR